MASSTIVVPKELKVVFDRTASAAVPLAPTLTSVTPGNGENTVIWTSSAGTTNYRLYFSTSSPVTTSDSFLSTATATSVVHTGLVNGTVYYYAVAAESVGGVSALSNELSGTPSVIANTLSTEMDGVNDHINFGNVHNFDNATAFTFSIWLRPQNVTAQKCIWSKTDGSVDGWGLYMNASGEIFLQMRAGGQNRSHTTSSTPFSALTWMHLVMTYDGSQNINGINFYVDGAFDSTPASGTVTNTLIVANDSLFGRRGTSFHWPGHMDEASFWDLELSASEVSELYNSGTPGNLTSHSQAVNLLNWYRLGDADTAPTVTDNAGSDDGTLTNGAAFDSEVPP